MPLEMSPSFHSLSMVRIAVERDSVKKEVPQNDSHVQNALV